MAQHEHELSDAVLDRREAALQQIRQWGDPSLRATARPIDTVDNELVSEARRLITIMDAALGAGLAATQVGILRRYFVYREGDETLGTATALINPVIEWASDELATATEGCLSLQGVAVDVERPRAVRVSGLDLSGHDVVIEAEGGLARRLQHEIDHLDGVLMLDRAPKDQRKAAVRALREGVPMDRDDLDVVAE